MGRFSASPCAWTLAGQPGRTSLRCEAPRWSLLSKTWRTRSPRISRRKIRRGSPGPALDTLSRTCFVSESMSKARRNKILDVASDLAEEGGFDNVRQRDVAEQAGVALGTL